MSWYNSIARADYNPGRAAAPSEKAGWVSGTDGIRKEDGKRVEVTLMYLASDSVRQALAVDTSNQLKKVGIDVKTEDINQGEAYDRAQSEPLTWGWGAHTPTEFYNIYHSMEGTGLVGYSPHANSTMDQYMDGTLAGSDLGKLHEL